jgi:putative acetyltransferase
MVSIRHEQPQDIPSIQKVNELAFGRVNEAELVNRLRDRGAATLSLVTVEDEHVIGHILFSPVTIVSGASSFEGVGLAPVAVLPEYQKQGIGSELIRQGVKELKDAGHSVVVVLGHPDYYPRFGFVPASRYGIICEYDVPDEAFMALILDEKAYDGMTGRVKYHPEFNEV